MCNCISSKSLHRRKVRVSEGFRLFRRFNGGTVGTDELYPHCIILIARNYALNKKYALNSECVLTRKSLGIEGEAIYRVQDRDGRVLSSLLQHFFDVDSTRTCCTASAISVASTFNKCPRYVP